MREIIENRESNCSGCGACYNVCPVSAIEMRQNEEGFYVPYIDNEKCIKCKKCVNVCPNIYKNREDRVKCYAVWADDEVRRKSSSGGVFSILAKTVLNIGGVVFGAAWTDDFYVKHIYITSEAQLELLRTSKYVQSDIGDSFKLVKQFLRQEKQVLFVGTPCQVVGLKAFLEGENTDKLILVDFICYCTPPIDLLRKYLDETYGLENLKEFSFRNKEYGWISHATKAVLKNGKTIHSKKMDSYMEGYFKGLYARNVCNQCKYSGQNHYADLTLGDFWKIEEHDASWNDGKGTSMVLVNTEKGEAFFKKIKPVLSRYEQVPAKWIREGQHNCKQAHPTQKRFQSLLKYKTFSEAVDMSINEKYDIGMVCVQSYQNYGSALTNFALFQVLKDLGYSVLIITQPTSSEIKPSNVNNFINNPYESFDCAKTYANKEQMRVLNKNCSTFIVGSDQLFNYEIYKRIDGFIKLDWVDDENKKISYSTSFGRNEVFGTIEEAKEFEKYIKRFTAVSVREKSGLGLLQKHFGVDAKQVIDPVFLCDVKHYKKLCENVEVPKGKIFAYVLEPTKEKADAIKCVARSMGKDIIAIPDKWMNKEYVDKIWDIPTLIGQKNEVWLKLVIESDFIITDSFHGMCFAIIFEKQFFVIDNKKRGTTRFTSLLRQLGLMDRMYFSPEELKAEYRCDNRIDYQRVNEILRTEKKYGFEWLKNALSEEKEVL